MNEPARHKSIIKRLALCGGVCIFLILQVFAAYGDSDHKKHNKGSQSQVLLDAKKMIKKGRHTFRFDTFGDEAFWGDTLRLHQAIAGENNGGVGPGVSPNTALAVGLKVDKRALPKSLRKAIKNGNVDLNDPATTLALLKLNAVVGVTGFMTTEHCNPWAFNVRCVTPR